MPSHPDRVRRNQPEVSHGIDCNCPPCLRRLMSELSAVPPAGLHTLTRKYDHDFSGPVTLSKGQIEKHGPALVAASADLLNHTWVDVMIFGEPYRMRSADVEEIARLQQTPDRRACPRCAGPSLSGGICLSCLRGPDEPTNETPWAV